MKAIKRLDRRTQRTRRQLSQALVDLIKEKRFDDITVQNVADRADVGRSTFYSHFRDKEDLFEQQWERFVETLADRIDWDNAGKGTFVPVGHLFQHLQEVQSFYRALLRSRKIEPTFKSGIEYLSQEIKATLNQRLKGKARQTGVPNPILANYLATQLFAMLKWWLDAGMPYPPEKMDEIFHRLVNPTLAAMGFADAKA